MIQLRKNLSLIFLLLILIPVATGASTDDKRSVHHLTTPPEAAPASILGAQRPVDLIEAHRNFQIQREQQVAEIQRIMEQARTQQQAMRASSAAHKAQGTSTVVPGVDIQEALRNQKLPLVPKSTKGDLSTAEAIEAIAIPPVPPEKKDKKGQ